MRHDVANCLVETSVSLVDTDLRGDRNEQVALANCLSTEAKLSPAIGDSGRDP